MTTSEETRGRAELPRRLGLLDSLSLVIGVVIGGGIFVVPNLVARELKTAPATLAVWVFAGVISFFGALACAELGAAIPATGGQYVFLRETYGPMVGFLCGWSMFLVARTAQIAWLCMTMALYIGYFVALTPMQMKVLAVAALFIVSAINYRGVKAGAAFQNLFTAAKIAGLLLIVGSAFLWSGKAAAATVTTGSGSGFSFSSFGIALVAAVLAYDGWVQVSFVAGEIRDPQRNILRALAIGVMICIAVYLLMNLAYMRVLPLAEIAASPHVGASVAERVLGARGGGLVSLIILLSILGALNGCVLMSPRVYFAQARDGLFFRKFGEVHPRYQTPSFAIVVQGLWAVLLIVSGSYETLMDYAMFATWLSYGLMVAGVIVLRYKRPQMARPYRMWGYPVTPLLFVGTTVWFLGNMLVTRPVPSLIGLGLIATGVPVFFFWARREQR